MSQHAANSTRKTDHRQPEHEQEDRREESPRRDSREAACADDSCSLGVGGLFGGHDVNVGDVERVLSVMGGGMLAVFGAARGGLAGLGLAIVGGGLLYRGITGHCEAYHSLGIDTADDEKAGSPERSGGTATA